MSLIEIDWRPDSSRLRQFSIIWMLGFLLVGLLVAFRTDWFAEPRLYSFASGVWATSILVGAVGLLMPNAVRPLYLVWMGLAFPFGFLLSNLFLAMVFYGFFTPLGLFFRLIGRDPLGLRKSENSSTWARRQGTWRAGRYFRQY